MATSDKRKLLGSPRDGAFKPSIESVVRLHKQAYEEQAKASNVQEQIAQARASWHEWYGVDPAAARFESTQ
jgi:thiamine biosynthesis lipoprotein ApbE